MKYTAVIQGQRIEVEMDRLPGGRIEGRSGGRRYSLEVKTIEPGVYWIVWNNRSIEIGVAPAGDAYAVTLDGRRVPVEIVDARARLRKTGRQGQEGVADLRAPMPGKIVRLLVAEGAAVEAGQGLVVMEAMKMQNEIKSPKKGVVRRIGAGEGEAVNSGDLLVSVE